MQTALQRFREWAKRSSLNQNEIASLLGIHYTHLSKVLTGKRPPGLDTAASIEHHTGIPASSWSDKRFGSSGRRRPANGQKAQIGVVSHGTR